MSYSSITYPSIIRASSETLPFSSIDPPHPTEDAQGLISHSVQPATAADTQSAPLERASHPTQTYYCSVDLVIFSKTTSSKY